MELRFKKCAITDLEVLQKLAINTFVTAFADNNNPKDFKDYISKAFSQEQLRSELNNHDSTFYFVLCNGELIGYCKINRMQAQSEFQEPEGMELERIYITAAYQSLGLGAKVLAFIEQLAIEYNKGYVWLGVWEHNPNAIRFYQKSGYRKIGTHSYFIGNDRQTDWIFKKELNKKSQIL